MYNTLKWLGSLRCYINVHIKCYGKHVTIAYLVTPKIKNLNNFDVAFLNGNMVKFYIIFFKGQTKIARPQLKLFMTHDFW